MSAREALGVLGLTAADPRQLRGAYLAAVKAAHPDKPGGDAAQLRKVIEAYEVLQSRPGPSPTPTPPKRPASRHLEITPAEAVIGGVVSAPLEGGGNVAVRLPPGLRVGDLVAVCGTTLTVSIAAIDGAAVIGDHLCLTIKVERAVLSGGGEIQTQTPRGPLRMSISPQDGARGLVRAPGAGLPARGSHPCGDLLVKLEAAPTEVFESRARLLLRRFTAAWAA